MLGLADRCEQGTKELKELQEKKKLNAYQDGNTKPSRNQIPKEIH